MLQQNINHLYLKSHFPSLFSSCRCLSLSRARWETPLEVMWPLCRLSYRTHRTVWCRVPWTREEAPPEVSWRPPKRAPASPTGTRRDLIEYSSDIQSRKTKKGPGWIMFKDTRPNSRIGGRTIPYTFRHFSSLSCSRTLRQDTQLLMDILLAGLLDMGHLCCLQWCQCLDWT